MNLENRKGKAYEQNWRGYRPVSGAQVACWA